VCVFSAGAGELIPLGMQDLCQGVHSRAAYADKVNVLFSSKKIFHGKTPSFGIVITIIV